MDITEADDVSARRREVVLAGHTGQPQPALAALDDADPTVRAAGLGALARLGQLSTSQLCRGLHDHAVTARRAAELAAVAAPDPAVDAALLAMLTGQDATLVEVAAWALGERHQESTAGSTTDVVAALIPIARSHTDALCREAAVAALGATAHADALTAILEATRDKTTVRRRAIIALAPFDGPLVDAALAEAAQDRDWQVRQAAEDLRADDNGPDDMETDDVSVDGP